MVGANLENLSPGSFGNMQTKKSHGRVWKSSVRAWLPRLSLNLGGSCQRGTVCEREPRNAKDRYVVAVALTKEGVTRLEIKKLK